MSPESEVEGAGACQHDATPQLQLVVFTPDPLLQSLHQREISFDIPWNLHAPLWRDSTAVTVTPPATITLEQGGRGTGGTTWLAGTLLAQFIAMHHDEVFTLLPSEFLKACHGRQWKNAVVVELGAGLGLVRL